MQPTSPAPADGAAPVDYVSGRTRIFGIVGDPIEQVRSPEMFTAELRRRGYDAVLVPLHVGPEDFDGCVGALLQLRNLGGLIFTIPYKARAMRFAQSIGPLGRAVGAINALAREGAGWKADIFDGLGCVEAFRRHRISFRDRSIMLLGAGGAGSAIGVAIAYEKPRAIVIHDLDARRAESLAARIRAAAPTVDVRINAPTVDGIDILMNATPMGMLDDARLPLEVASLPRDLIVFDAIVKPERTPLLALAQESGCHTIGGREMMLGQIARMVDFFGYPEQAR